MCIHELSPEHTENDALTLCGLAMLGSSTRKRQRQQLHMFVRLKFYVVNIFCRQSYHPRVQDMVWAYL